MIMDTKLTSIHFNEKVLSKTVGYRHILFQLFFWHYHISFPYWDTKVICHSHFFHICVGDLHVTLMLWLPCLKMSHDNYCLCVCLSQSWILYLIVNSCGVSYVNSDSHQMCTISLKYCSTVIGTLSFCKCLCHFLWHFNSFRNFNTEKLHSHIVKSRKSISNF